MKLVLVGYAYVDGLAEEFKDEDFVLEVVKTQDIRTYDIY